jgi:hypothetical protein
MHFQKTPGLAQVTDKLYHKITSGRGTAYPSGTHEFTTPPPPTLTGGRRIHDDIVDEYTSIQPVTRRV